MRRTAWCSPGSTAPRPADFAGFRVSRIQERRGGVSSLPQEPTTSLSSWTDAGPLEAGAEYTYTIAATDCVWEQYLFDPVTPPYLDPLNTLPLGPVHPGGLRRYVAPASGPEHFTTTLSDGMVPGSPWTYTYHNNVKFWLQNTSRSPVTISRMAITWAQPRRRARQRGHRGGAERYGRANVQRSSSRISTTSARPENRGAGCDRGQGLACHVRPRGRDRGPRDQYGRGLGCDPRAAAFHELRRDHRQRRHGHARRDAGPLPLGRSLLRRRRVPHPRQRLDRRAARPGTRLFLAERPGQLRGGLLRGGRHGRTLPIGTTTSTSPPASASTSTGERCWTTPGRSIPTGSTGGSMS